MKKKAFPFLAVLISLSLLLTTTALAYSLTPLCVRMSNPGSLKYCYTKSGSYIFSGAIATANTKWNAAANLINCTSQSSTSGANIYFYSDNYGDTGWAGLCRYPNAALPNTSTIKINEYYIGNPVGSTYNNNYAINVALHEMGHCYGLNHVSSTSSLMYSVAQPSITSIDTDSKNGVNAKYK